MQRIDASIPRAWRRRAGQLAAWTFARVVNRVDAWGAYVAPARREAVGKRTWTAPALKDRGEVELTPVRVAAHFGALDQGQIIGLHAISQAGTCKWGAIDIDRHGGPLDPTPETTFEAARFWFEVLVSLGFSPLLTDSNGDGGFHLRVFFDSPVPVKRVYWFLRWLVADYKSRLLVDCPETYPRADQLPPGGFGNWLRVFGQHHTNAAHWSRVWDGARWIDGDAAIDVILKCMGDSPALIPPEAAPPKPKPRPKPVSAPTNAGDMVKRCMAYISKMPDAISKQRGHDRTFNLACEIFRFGLDGADARSVFDWINANKTGGEPWDEAQVEHKLGDAKKRVQADGEFGVRLREDRVRSIEQPRNRRKPTQAVTRTVLTLNTSLPVLPGDSLPSFQSISGRGGA